MAKEGLLSVSVPDLAAILKHLTATPKEILRILRFSTMDAIGQGRTTLIGRGPAKDMEGIRKRYNIGYNKILSAIGKPRWRGLGAELDISGPKLPLHDFGKSKDIYPYGTATTELRDGYPVNMLHAFMHDGKIYQRQGGAKSPRIPIRWVPGLSVAEMAAQRTEVYPAVEKRIKEALIRRIGHYIDLFNKGGLPTRVWRGSTKGK
jgi:hypothetical protein